MTPADLDALERLNSLKDKGLLSSAEVEAEKRKILGQGARDGAAAPNHYPGSYGATPQWGINSISDIITARLGLDKIDDFSFKAFFSNVFGKHDPNEIENIFSVGTLFTTPRLEPGMGKFPSPWIFLRVLMASLIVYGMFYFAWTVFENRLLLPGLIFSGAFAVPFATLILFFELNTPRNVSITRTAMFIFLGGTISLLISLFLFDLTSLDSVFGASSAGFIEESGKLAAVILSLSYVDRARYPFRLNALLFGASVGAGFAIFETAGYILAAMSRPGGIEAVSNMITLRGLLSPFCHIAWTAIASAAYWSAQRKHKDIIPTLTSPEFLKIFLVPVVLHFVWNMSIGGIWMYFALGFVAWVVIISFVQTGLREVGEIAVISKRATVGRTH